MEDKIKRLMDHSNIDEQTAKDVLEKNNNNVLDAFEYLEKKNMVSGIISKKEISNEKKYVDYNSNQRYMDVEPQHASGYSASKNKINVEPVTKAEVKKEPGIVLENPVFTNTSKPTPVELKHEKYQPYKSDKIYDEKIPTAETYKNTVNVEAQSNIDVEEYKAYTDSSMKNVTRQILDWLLSALQYLVRTKLVIMRRNNVLIAVPLFIAVIVVALTFWGTIPVFFISLILGFRYFIESENEDDSLEERIKKSYKYDKKNNYNYRKTPYTYHTKPENQNPQHPQYPQNVQRPQHPQNPNAQQNQNFKSRNNYTEYYHSNQPVQNQYPNEELKNEYNKANNEYFEEIEKFQGNENILNINDVNKQN